MSVVEHFHRELNDFSVSLRDWEILDSGVTVLWGASGSGKSTIVNGLLGLDKKAELSWRWGETLMSDLPSGARQLGLVAQNPALFPNMSVRQNLLFPVSARKVQDWQQDFDWLIDKLGVKKLLNHSVDQLSGGESQRVALGRALIYRPQLLLLDEPFSSLDEGARKEMRQLIKEVCADWGVPVLLVTHDREDVEALATKVTEIDQGRITKERSL